MCQWFSTRLAEQKFMSMLGLVLGLPHEWDVCSSFRLSRDAFARPMRSEWRLGMLMDNIVEDIHIRRNCGDWAVCQSLRTPSILKSQESAALTSSHHLASPTICRPKISYMTAPSCVMSQASGDRRTYLQLSDTAGDKGGTIKFHDETTPHFDASSATKARADQLVTRLNLTAEQVSSVVSSSPALLTVSAQDFDKRLETLGMIMGTTENLTNMLLEHPNILHLHVDDGIQMKLEWLKKIGLTASEACSLLATYSPLSGARLDVMQTGVALLNDELQLASEQMAKVVLGKPSILTSSTEKLESKLRFFLDVLRLSKKELTTLVLKDPSVLRVSLANLQQKVNIAILSDK